MSRAAALRVGALRHRSSAVPTQQYQITNAPGGSFSGTWHRAAQRFTLTSTKTITGAKVHYTTGQGHTIRVAIAAALQSPLASQAVLTSGLLNGAAVGLNTVTFGGGGAVLTGGTTYYLLVEADSSTPPGGLVIDGLSYATAAGVATGGTAGALYYGDSYESNSAGLALPGLVLMGY